MLITTSGVTPNSARNRVALFCNEEFEIYWHGLAYVEGCAAGRQSIAKFAATLTRLEHEAQRLKGVYFVAVRDKHNGEWSACVDGSGLYQAFYSSDCIGTSFLRIATSLGLSAEELDPAALVEFLQLGCLYEDRTLFREIRKVGAREIIRLRSGKTEVLQKVLPDIAEHAVDLMDVLRQLASSAARERVSIDLTGGVDSRLLATVLSYYDLDFELAASGRQENADVQIAQEVATALSRNFYLTEHAAEKTDWQLAFAACDGLFDVAKANRPLQLQSARAKRGVTLALSGAGGELFKDFWWLQDFPFYNRRHISLERLIALRIAPTEPHHNNLHPNLQPLSRELRAGLLNALRSYSVEGNTRTYDRIYYGYKMRGVAGRFLTNSASVLNVHAPFLDRDAVAFGYQLPRRTRFFNRYHRAVMTQRAPEVARIKTTEGGMSASAEARLISRDLLLYAQDRAKRLNQKLRQHAFGTALKQESPDDPAQQQVIRRLMQKRRAIERLSTLQILNPALKLDAIPAGDLGSMLALDMLVEHLEQNAKSTFVHTTSEAA